MFLEHIQPLIRDNTELFGLLTFLIGLGFGHWFALGRDKRREFNDASLPIREWILREIDGPNPSARRPTSIELDTFVQCLSILDKRSFCKAYRGQQKAREQATEVDSIGQPFYKDDKPIVAHLRRCLRYTNRR